MMLSSNRTSVISILFFFHHSGDQICDSSGQPFSDHKNQQRGNDPYRISRHPVGQRLYILDIIPILANYLILLDH
jgi:hypothetical protein